MWYLVEGDGVSATISFASTIPLVYATTVKNIGRVIKLSDGTFATIKLSRQATETLIATLKNSNLSENSLKLLFKDLENTNFAKALAENPKLIDSWKVLENSARRTDINTLKFFDDPTVLASRQKILNDKIHEAFPNIPIEELTAIQHYTTNAHGNLNKALRGDIPMTDEFRAFDELINSGMDKLPKYNGDKVFRGVSCLPGESEVLFKSGSNFKVKEIKTNFVVYDRDFNPSTVQKIILEFVE